MTPSEQPDLFASVHFATDARLTQTPASVHSDALKGSALTQKVRHCASELAQHWRTTLPRASVGPARREPTRDEKIALSRLSIKELTNEKMTLIEDVDRYDATTKAARDWLKASHAQAPNDWSEKAKRERMVRHDAILAASTQWGKQVRRYREINQLIAALDREIDALERKKT